MHAGDLIVWRLSDKVLKALGDEPPAMVAARKDCIMAHTMKLAMLITFTMILSVGAGVLWTRMIPFAVLAAALTIMTVGIIYHVQNSAYYLGKFHGMAAAYANSPEIKKLVPADEEIGLAKKPGSAPPSGSGGADQSRGTGTMTEDPQ